MPSAAEPTVVLRRRSLGDVVLLGAITSALRGPVTVVTEARYGEVAARLAGVDQVVAWGDPVPRGPVIDLQGSWRTVLQFPWARRIRKHSVARRLRLGAIGQGRPPVVELYGRASGVRPVAPPWIRLVATERLALGVVPGASTALKAPPIDLLIEVGRRWSGPVIVFGGPGEDPVVNWVAAALRSARPVVEAGFRQTLEAFSQLAVVIAGDTGLLHLAAACGIPTVALAGPTHPDDGFLCWPQGRVVQRALSCRPCTLHRGRTCRVGGRPCLALEPDDVWGAVQEVAGALGCSDG